MDKEKDLLTFLEEAGGGLSVYHNALRNELKIEAAHELWNVHDQDLTDIRMLPADIQKLRKHLRKEHPSSALGKLKKLTSSVSVKRSLSKKVAKSSSDAPALLPVKKSSGEAKMAAPAVISAPRPIGKRIIPPNQVHVVSTIGVGEFGKVQRGVWTDEAGQKYDVALKMLNQDKMAHGLQEFLKEAGNMQAVRHPAIIEFYGVVFDGQNSLMLVSEYAPMHALLECLQAQPDTFGVVTLSLLAEQVAGGMSYLESQRLVHRDLAARNILVFTAEKVKISDFGLSQALGLNRDYYETKYDVNLKLPIAWCPPESIKNLQFSSASDVWSFGVTLWEMFSYADKPWGMMTAVESERGLSAGLLTKKILAAIDMPSGQRLEKPACCPRDYYELMRRCWEHEPSRRPKFADISVELPRLRPHSLRAVRGSGSAADRPRGMLQYSARDVIILLDDRPVSAPSSRFWFGVNSKDVRHPGFFDSTDVEAIGSEDSSAGEQKRHSSLPKDASAATAAFRHMNRGSPTKLNQRKKITSQMIGKPENDLRHTGHIGYDGVMFGDVSFIGNNYDKIPLKAAKSDGSPDSPILPTSAATQAHCVEELNDFQFPDLSLAGSLEISTSFIDEMMKELHSYHGAGAGDASSGRQVAIVDCMQRSMSDSAAVSSGPVWGDAASNGVARNGSALEVGQPSACRLPACGTGRAAQDEVHEPSGAVSKQKRGGSKMKLILPGSRERERKDSASSPVPGSSALSNGGTGIKAMSAADEKLIDEAIELANHFASSSLQSAHTPRDVEVEPDTPSKSKSRFSFKFPSKKTSPVAERKTFTDDLVQKAVTADAVLSPEAEEAYNMLVAKGGSTNVVPPVSAGTAQADVRLGSRTGTTRARQDDNNDCDQPAAAAEVDINPFRKLKEGPVLARAAPRQINNSGRTSSFRLAATESSSAPAHSGSLPRAAPRSNNSAAGRPPPLVLAARPPLARGDDDSDDLSDMPSSPPPPVPLPRSRTVDDDDDDECIGVYDNMDPFWRQEMRAAFEADEQITGMKGHYKLRSETVSYEDLLEFSRTSGARDLEKAVQVLLKVLGKEVSESECLAALKVTNGDLLAAIKYVKLRKLLSLELGADLSACKEALMNSNWDVQNAADYVLDHRRRINSDVVDV